MLNESKVKQQAFNARPARSKLAVIVRSVGERTTDLCVKLLSESVPVEDIAVITERPFSKALRVGFEEALRRGAEWTLVIDADVLVAPSVVGQFLETADSLKNFFVLLGAVFDKFFQVLRPAGNHFYKTELLEQAMDLIPEEGSSLRPESSTIKAMAKRGYAFCQRPLLVGLHDFEQSYADIARKCFLQAHKHRQHLPVIMPIWQELQAEDPDFTIALAAVEAGLAYQGEVFVDADFLGEQTKGLLSAYNLATPKPALSLLEYDNAKIVKMLNAGLKAALHSSIQKDMFPRELWSRDYVALP